MEYLPEYFSGTLTWFCFRPGVTKSKRNTEYPVKIDGFVKKILGKSFEEKKWFLQIPNLKLPIPNTQNICLSVNIGINSKSSMWLQSAGYRNTYQQILGS